MFWAGTRELSYKNRIEIFCLKKKKPKIGFSKRWMKNKNEVSEEKKVVICTLELAKAW